MTLNDLKTIEAKLWGPHSLSIRELATQLSDDGYDGLDLIDDDDSDESQMGIYVIGFNQGAAWVLQEVQNQLSH